MQVMTSEELLSAYDASCFKDYKKQAKQARTQKLEMHKMKLVDEEKKQSPLTADKLGAFFV